MILEILFDKRNVDIVKLIITDVNYSKKKRGEKESILYIYYSFVMILCLFYAVYFILWHRNE